MEKVLSVFMKRFLLTTLLGLLFLTSQAQQDTKYNIEIANRIRSATEKYLYAEASSDTLQNAINDAIVMLGQQIVTKVKSETKTSIVNTSVGNSASTTMVYDQVSKVFSDVQLSDYQTLVLAIPDKKNHFYTAFVYIDRETVKEIVAEIADREAEAEAEREKKAEDDAKFYYEEARKAYDDIRIGDALKYLYWSYAICNGRHITIEENGKKVPADNIVETMIDDVLRGINVSIISSEKVKINEFQSKVVARLDVTFNDGHGPAKKVTNLDFEYNDGNTYRPGARVRDGITQVDLQYEMEEFKFRCIYKYDSSETPKDVYEIVKGTVDKKFASAVKNVKTNGNAAKVQPAEHVSSVPVSSVAVSTNSKTEYSPFENAMNSVETAINTMAYDDVQSLFTAEAFTSFKKLVKYGKATIIGKPSYKFLDFGETTICRSIPMRFMFRNNKQFVENVTFRFNKNGKIESLAFTLSKVAENDIVGNAKWDNNSKLTLMSFLEDYQTAYALGNIDYLESIFSEKALIITGNKVERTVLSDGIVIQENVKYDTLSKKNYIDKLRTHFATKEYINLNFTDTEFERATNGEEFYGIRVRQEYFSSNYGDVGYLFLLVDLRGELPVIHVRAWQNDKLPLDALFGMSDVY